jgi:Bacterial TSP3 repeat/Concanavalin A-like lectin/glucanases superfamily
MKIRKRIIGNRQTNGLLAYSRVGEFARDGILTGWIMALVLMFGLTQCVQSQTPDTWVLLDMWSFQDSLFSTDFGYLPIASTNVMLSPTDDGNGVLIASNGPAFLQYQTIEADGSTNLTLPSGTISFWFSPTNWSGTNAGGTGPGTWGRFLEVGAGTTNMNAQFFSLYTDPGGGNLYLAGKTNGGSATLFVSAPICWTNGAFHFVGVTYSPTGSVMYLDGQVAAIGSGISVWPGSEVYTNGFFLGSDGAGSQLQQAMGVFDDLETYDSPIDAATMGGIYNFHTISYTNVPPVFIAPEGATFTFQASPTLDAVTGQGNLQLAGVTNSTGCIENNSVWLTNVIASVVNSNQTVNFTFSIAGGADGVLYDVFANSVPSMGNSTVPWVWEGQGYHCNTYMLTNFPLGTVFCVLGSTTIDSDNDGLPDAFEKLIGSNPNSPSTASDGLSDLYKYQHGLPFGSVTAVPSLGSLSVQQCAVP